MTMMGLRLIYLDNYLEGMNIKLEIIIQDGKKSKIMKCKVIKMVSQSRWGRHIRNKSNKILVKVF